MRWRRTSEPIVTDRLVLRRPVPGDGERFRGAVDVDLIDAHGWTPGSIEQPSRYLETKAGRRQHLIVEERATSAFLGFLRAIPWQSGAPGYLEIGVVLVAGGRGRGIAVEALAAAIPHLRGSSDLVLETAVDNVGMRVVATRTGFEERDRYQQRLPDGQVVESVQLV